MILLAHGGASSIEPDPESEKAYRAGFARSLSTSAKSARRAVVEVISALEADPLWNAGRGSVLAGDGLPRCDASLALSDGRSGGAGDLLLVSSPIRLADAVARRSHHTLLVGPEAEGWAMTQGVSLSPPEERITPDQERLWKEGSRDSLGTVGAVALDRKGRLAAGTSTGGMRDKAPGRVGDSAIIGGGTWCSRECAISMTGDGDHILARSSAARIALGIERGQRPKRAITKELRSLREEGAVAGCIVLLASGQSFMMRNCPAMHRGKFAEGVVRSPKASGGKRV